MWSVLGKTLSVGTTTAPTSADGGFSTPVTGYGNEPYNISNYIPWDFYQIPLINLELTVLSILSWAAPTIGMTNSSSSTDLSASDATRSVQVINTNKTTNNWAWISFRSYAMNGVATLQSWAKILAQFTARTATTLTADLVVLTNNAGTIAEKLRVTGAGEVAATIWSLYSLYNLGTPGTTNFERLSIQAVSNILYIRSWQWGSGTSRAIVIWSTSTWDAAPTTNVSYTANAITVNLRSTWSASPWFVVSLWSNSLASGTIALATIWGTINQSGTAWFTVLDLNYIETAVGSWSKDFILCRKSSWSTLFWVDSNGKTVQDATMTAGWTTGNQTINKPSGSVNIAAAWSSVVVTNSLVNANSIITCVIMTNDSTAILKNVVPAAWSFTIRTTAAVTAETKIWFVVHN